MDIYLGGGWNAEGGETALEHQLSCVSEMLHKAATKQILHIPFARTGIMKKNRNAFGPVAFQLFIKSIGVEYLNASYIEDIEAFSGDTIYINGGNDCEFLLKMCLHPSLHSAILKARVIIGESCGSMILGKYFITNKNDSRVDGLNLVEDSIIIPHYSERNNNSILLEGKQSTGVGHGVGIDETTFIRYRDGAYGEIVGGGKVFHL